VSKNVIIRATDRDVQPLFAGLIRTISEFP